MQDDDNDKCFEVKQGKEIENKFIFLCWGGKGKIVSSVARKDVTEKVTFK